MRKYLEIQSEVLKDFNINQSDLLLDRKNSLNSTLNLFFEVGLILTKDASQAEDFERFLAEKYELDTIQKIL